MVTANPLVAAPAGGPSSPWAGIWIAEDIELIEWVLEYLAPRMRDPAAADWLRTVVDDNLGSVWIPDLSPDARDEIFGLLRGGLLEAAERELPDGPGKAATMDQLRELVGLTD